MKTTVEWLQCELKKIPFINVIEVFEQAKEKEKLQIKKAYEDGKNLIEYKDEWGERYYNETYNQNK